LDGEEAPTAGLTVDRYLELQLAEATWIGSPTTLDGMGITARQAHTLNMHGRPPTGNGQIAGHLALSVIGSIAGSLAFLILVGVATWIVISPGAEHLPWQ
jgi:hypothetical protein